MGGRAQALGLLVATFLDVSAGSSTKIADAGTQWVLIINGGITGGGLICCVPVLALWFHLHLTPYILLQHHREWAFYLSYMQLRHF